MTRPVTRLAAVRLAPSVAPPGELQHQVGAGAAGQPQYLGGEIGSARVEDMVGAQRPRCLVLAWRGSGDNHRAVVLGHLHRSLAGSACRGVDQHGLPAGDAAKGPERGQGGGPVHEQAHCLLLGPAHWHRDHRDRGQRRVLSKGAASDAGTDDAGSGFQAGDGSAPGDDLAYSLLACQIRRLRASEEPAVGLRDVAEVDAGGGDPDQDVARARGRDRHVGDQSQVLRAVQGRLLQGAHGSGDAHGHRGPFPWLA